MGFNDRLAVVVYAHRMVEIIGFRKDLGRNVFVKKRRTKHLIKKNTPIHCYKQSHNRTEISIVVFIPINVNATK